MVKLMMGQWKVLNSEIREITNTEQTHISPQHSMWKAGFVKLD